MSKNGKEELVKITIGPCSFETAEESYEKLKKLEKCSNCGGNMGITKISIPTCRKKGVIKLICLNCNTKQDIII